MQREILLEALAAFEEMKQPGEIKRLEEEIQQADLEIEKLQSS